MNETNTPSTLAPGASTAGLSLNQIGGTMKLNDNNIAAAPEGYEWPAPESLHLEPGAVHMIEWAKQQKKGYEYAEVKKDGLHYLVILAKDVLPDAPDMYGADFVLQFHEGQLPTFVVDRALKEKIICDLLYSWRVIRSRDSSARQIYAKHQHHDVFYYLGRYKAELAR